MYSGVYQPPLPLFNFGPFIPLSYASDSVVAKILSTGAKATEGGGGRCGPLSIHKGHLFIISIEVQYQ